MVGVPQRDPLMCPVGRWGPSCCRPFLPVDAAAGGADPAGPAVHGGRSQLLCHRPEAPAGVQAAPQPQPPPAVMPGKPHPALALPLLPAPLTTHSTFMVLWRKPGSWPGRHCGPGYSWGRSGVSAAGPLDSHLAPPGWGVVCAQKRQLSFSRCVRVARRSVTPLDRGLSSSRITASFPPAAATASALSLDTAGPPPTQNVGAGSRTSLHSEAGPRPWGPDSRAGASLL